MSYGNADTWPNCSCRIIFSFQYIKAQFWAPSPAKAHKSDGTQTTQCMRLTARFYSRMGKKNCLVLYHSSFSAWWCTVSQTWVFATANLTFTFCYQTCYSTYRNFCRWGINKSWVTYINSCWDFMLSQWWILSGMFVLLVVCYIQIDCNLSKQAVLSNATTKM